jgi:cytochrome c556
MLYHPSMKTYGWSLAVCLFLLFLLFSGCAKPQTPEPDLLKTATIKDIMDSMVDPSAEFLFESVAEVADEHGITEKAPQTDEEWRDVRRRAVTLVEAPNLLIMMGRKVAQPGEKSQNPQVELQPEQIQALLESDRPNFLARARNLQDAANAAVKAADAKNKDMLFEASTQIDRACENCHIHYWYPNDKAAVESFKEN